VGVGVAELVVEVLLVDDEVVLLDVVEVLFETE
jgi:hypothetical protein